jgi:hypothetical protein
VLHAHAARGGSIQVGAVRKLALFAQEHFARLALGNDSSGLVVLAYNTLRAERSCSAVSRCVKTTRRLAADRHSATGRARGVGYRKRVCQHRLTATQHLHVRDHLPELAVRCVQDEVGRNLGARAQTAVIARRAAHAIVHARAKVRRYSDRSHSADYPFLQTP